MSFEAHLVIDGINGGKEIRLLHVSYAVHREVDATGRPSSHNHGGSISFEIESTDSSELWEWMIDQFSTKDGKITFMKRDEKQKMREVSWKKGYIVQFSESFDSTGANPISTHFTVSAEKIKNGNGELINPWPKS